MDPRRPPRTGGRIVALWLIVIGINYLPLALHAMSLSPSGRLDHELAWVDVHGELRHYTTAQLWVVVPLLFLVLAVRQARRH